MIVQQDGGEFTFNDFMQQLVLERIELNFTTSDTSQQDGVVETLNKMIVNDTNAMIKCVGCPKSFWVPTMEMAVHSQNRSTLKALSTMIPSYELWLLKKHDIHHLHIWE